MNDDAPSTGSQQVGWIDKIAQLLQGEPKNRTELMEVLRQAHKRSQIHSDALTMIEGVLRVSEVRVREIMIPRSQMVVIDKDQAPEEFLPIVVESTHSRFPVIGENKDDVLGILLAKDLLKFCFESHDKSEFNIDDIIRTVKVVPESKRIDVLLEDFKESRNHMAIVVDEYGGVSGLVTIEDILEQIVGDIEDEHSDEADDENIQQHQKHVFSVKALTPIDEFNTYFESDLKNSEVETIGGLIMQAFGHLPTQGETVTISGFRFKVLEADERRLQLVQAVIVGSEDESADIPMASAG